MEVPGTLGELLAERRHSRFVGREPELSVLRAALATSAPPFAVVHVHGPGGVGKTALLDAFARIATGAGATVVRLDCRDLPPSPPAVVDAIRSAFGGGGVDLTTALQRVERPVLLLDTYERLAASDDWVRTELACALPAGTILVLAGRAPPAPGWRADPAWRDLLRVLALRNLRPDDSRSLLRAVGVRDDAVAGRVHRLTHGHPLALSLMADVLARDDAPTVDALTPDVVAALLRRFVEVVPDERQRRAIEVCAIPRVTTEGLLRDAVGVEDAHDLFQWLRGLSFVEAGPDGVFPHDVARDALAADLRMRDPEAYQQVFRAVTGHVLRRLRTTTGHEQQRVLYDVKYLHRYQRLTGGFTDWDTIGRYYPEPARPADRATVLALLERWEGPESAAIARRWLDRQPDAFHVVRHPDGGARGVIACLDLTRATADDVAADPGAHAAWSYVDRTAPARRGEVVTQYRYFADRDAYQSPSPTVNATPVLAIQHWLTTPRLAWSFITLADVEAWQDYFAFFDLHRARGADFSVGGRRYGLVGHDFRQVTPQDWLELVLERDLSGMAEAGPATPGDRVLVLSRPDFDSAVRQALRCARRPDLLAGNPLVRSRLVRAGAADGTSEAHVLARLLTEAVDALRADPRDDALFRVVDRTYLRPAPTQEAAAERLGLPMTTYKRYLRQAVDRVAGVLWSRELEAGTAA